MKIKSFKILLLVVYLVFNSEISSYAFFKSPLANFIASLVFIGGGVGAYLQGDQLIGDSNNHIEQSNLYKLQSIDAEDRALQSKYSAGEYYGKYLEGNNPSNLLISRAYDRDARTLYNKSVNLSNLSFSSASDAQKEAEQGGLYKGSGLVSASIGTYFLINGFVRLYKKKHKPMVKNNIEFYASSNLIDSRIGIKYKF